MNIVITMAGLGSRFQKAGYKEPKFMIKSHGKTLFEWSMESLLNFNNRNPKYIFIVRKECNAREFIKEKMMTIGICDIEVIEIDYLTDGQATTAMLASNLWNKDDELFIYNIDTYVEANEMKYDQIRGVGFIPCFLAEGDHWSFVKLGENSKAIEVREKQRISEFCSIGAYYFKSCKLYEDIYKEYYSNDSNNEKSEKYIAPLYNHMIKKGMGIYISVIPTEKVHCLGTPEELNIFENETI